MRKMFLGSKEFQCPPISPVAEHAQILFCAKCENHLFKVSVLSDVLACACGGSGTKKSCFFVATEKYKSCLCRGTRRLSEIAGETKNGRCMFYSDTTS